MFQYKNFILIITTLPIILSSCVSANTQFNKSQKNLRLYAIKTQEYPQQPDYWYELGHAFIGVNGVFTNGISAPEAFQKALTLYQEQGDEVHEADAAFYLATAYRLKNKPSEAIDFNERAIQLNLELNRPYMKYMAEIQGLILKASFLDIKNNETNAALDDITSQLKTFKAKIENSAIVPPKGKRAVFYENCSWPMRKLIKRECNVFRFDLSGAYAMAMESIADQYYQRQMYKKSSALFLLAKKEFTEIEHDIGVARQNIMLSKIAQYYEGDIEKAASLLKSGIYVFSLEEYPTFIGPDNYRLGLLQMYLKKWKMATVNLSKAHPYFVMSGDKKEAEHIANIRNFSENCYAKEVDSEISNCETELTDENELVISSDDFQLSIINFHGSILYKEHNTLFSW